MKTKKNLQINWLHHQLRTNKDSIAIITAQQSYTFLDIYLLARRRAWGMYHAGIKKKSRIGLYGGNHLDTVITLCAASFLHVEVVCLNCRLSAHELSQQLSLSEVTQVITDQPLEIDQMFEQLDMKRLMSDDWLPLYTSIDLNQVFTIMFTSGTSGQPKAVLQTYGNHAASVEATNKLFNLQIGEVWYNAMPLYHVSGLSIICRMLVTGMTMYLANHFDAIDMMTTPCHYISLVPLMLHQCLATQLPLKTTIKCLLVGGQAANLTDLSQAIAYKWPIYLTYGLTESCSQFMTTKLTEVTHPLTVGRPLIGQAKLQNIGVDGIGQLYLQGDNISPAYLHQQPHDDWFATGDLAYQDKQGQFYIVSRESDLIISGGENIYPREIEQLLMSFDAQTQWVVMPQHDEIWGQVPVIIYTGDVEYTLSQIQAYLEPLLAKYKQPRQLYRIDQFPLTGSLKINKSQLIDWLKHKEK